MVRFGLFILSIIAIGCSSGHKIKNSFVPDWAKDAIFYQIFPERFANGDASNDPVGKVAWNSVPTINNYFGGDFKGIIDHLDYLSDLGINAIYLNPIFESNTNHKYHTKDYLKVDPHFGDDETFLNFLHECHKRNIRVIIDGVFNHTGTDFFAFRDIIENGEHSKYLNWYSIHSFPLRLPPEKPNYEAWWGIGELPKLMADEPEVRKYLFDATSHWTKRGIDGWRLDVPNEMSHDFWIQWRKLVKSENSDALIIGELWDDATPWLKGDQFDAVMNYRFRGACVGFIALENRSAIQFDSILAAVRSDYPHDVTYALQNLIGSHDTERFLTLSENDTTKLKLALLMQMTYVGSPLIYYGDEIGMTGGKDPDCRRTMNWDTTAWNMNLWSWYRKMIHIRKDHEIFRKGNIKPLIANGTTKLFGFLREYKDTTAVIMINMSRATVPFPKSVIPSDVTDWIDLISETVYPNHELQKLPPALTPRTGLILIGKTKDL
jgi:cyclomaltodextrinase